MMLGLGGFDLCLFGTDASGACLPDPPKATASPYTPYVGFGIAVVVISIIAFAFRAPKGKS
jgi:hypothetical protein